MRLPNRLRIGAGHFAHHIDRAAIGEALLEQIGDSHGRVEDLLLLEMSAQTGQFFDVHFRGFGGIIGSQQYLQAGFLKTRKYRRQVADGFIFTPFFFYFNM